MPRTFLTQTLLSAVLISGVFLAVGSLHLKGFDSPGWALFLTAVVAGALLSVIFSAYVIFGWARPSRRLGRAADRLAEGDWRARLPEGGTHEVRDLAERLNRVAVTAQGQIDSLLAQRHDRQSLADTLPDPVLATDAQQRIELINAPAARLLELSPTQVIGKKFFSVVNDEAMLALFDQEPKSETPCPRPREVRIMRDGQRITYQAVVAKTAGGGKLVMLRNVTTMSAMVQMKTDFVANASHELRTPIAAIKIAFDTLREVIEEDPEQSQRCIQIIDGHIKRLEEMLGDLLDLSRVENDEIEQRNRLIRSSELFTPLRATMLPTATQKLVELKFEDRNPDGTEFYSDDRLLNLVLRNLVENAIKFTPTGGAVTIFVESDSSAPRGDIVIGVTDTGIGIAPEHIERVFERFYQVDAARSGHAGRGTGLGLAIVKHAVAGLKGTVQIRSKPGQGTTVSCIIPNRQPEPSDDAVRI